MLWKFTHKNKHGNLRSRIMYRPNGEPFKHGPGFGNFVAVSVFKYHYEHPVLSPSLVTINDQKYIVPSWQKVLPETTLKDIIWDKPTPKPSKEVSKPTKLEFKFESKSDPGSFYVVTVVNDKVNCNCSGRWRAKDKQCRHMKEVKQNLGL